MSQTEVNGNYEKRVVYLTQQEKISDLEYEVDNLIEEDESRVDLLPLLGLLRFNGKLCEVKFARIEINSHQPLHENGILPIKATIDSCKEPLISFVVAATYPLLFPEDLKVAPECIRFPPFEERLLFLLKHRDNVDVESCIKSSFKKDGKAGRPFDSKNPIFDLNYGGLKILFAFGDMLFNGIMHYYKSLNILELSRTTTVYIPKGMTVKDFIVPNGYEIRELKPKEALFAMENYQYTSERGVQISLYSAEYGLAIGAFVQGADQPVSWICLNQYGCMTALVTLPDHRRKGLGRAVVGKLANKIIAMGYVPFAFIEHQVETSVRPISLFRSLGFEVLTDKRSYIFSSGFASCCP